MFYAAAVQLLYMIVGGIAMMTTSETINLAAQECQTGGAAETSSTEGAVNEPCSSLKTCATLC